MSEHVSISESNLRLVNEFNTAVFADNDLDRLEEFFAPTIRHLEEGDVQFEGLDAYREYFEEMLGTWEDISLDVRTMVGDDEHVMYNFTMSGTATDDLSIGGTSYDAAGKSFSWDGFVSMTIEDDSIVETYLLTNEAALLRDLDVIPPRRGA